LFISALDLTAQNLTQIEKLGGKEKTHILAIKKPSPKQINQNKSPFVASPVYREVTYPLSADYQPDYNTPLGNTASTKGPGNVSNNQAERNAEFTQTSNSHENQLANASPQDAPIDEAHPPMQHSAEDPGRTTAPNPDIAAPTSIAASQSYLPAESQPAIQRTAVSTAVPVPQYLSPSRIDGRPAEILSVRDLQASRTFALVETNRGDHPWDLGSARWNLQTVMGESIADWLLPIRRSPCCKHEDDESHFQVGIIVDFLRVNLHFTVPDGIRSPPKNKKYCQKMREAERNEQDIILPANDPSIDRTIDLPMAHINRESRIG
jgi:palmitoyltransferase